MKRIALGLTAAAATAALAATPALACRGGGKTTAVRVTKTVSLAYVKHRGPGRGRGPIVRLPRKAHPAPAIVRAGVFGARRGHFLFAGTLTAAPGGSATSLTITVTGGDREALAKMLGQSTTQTFAVSSSTKVVKPGSGNTSLADLAQGDLVWVEVAAPHDSTLAQIEQQAAVRVVDRAAPSQTQGVRYVFRGTLTAPAGTSTLSVQVTGGDVRALKLLISQPAAQTFAFDSSTRFVRVSDGRPSQASASQLQTGDRVQVTVRAAADATLAQVEQAPATQVLARAASSAASQA